MLGQILGVSSPHHNKET